MRKWFLGGGALAAVGAAAVAVGISTSGASDPAALPQATTPIQHVVVIFGENISFDHYFGTYPNAQNLPGEPPFTAAAGTPSVNGLTPALLTHNPNLDNPTRLAPSQALTCSQNHSYAPEEAAFDQGAMDKFVQNTTGSGCTQSTTPDRSNYGPTGIVMDYYDGNTVTGMWNYAQHFALSDNSYNSQFGPSTPGALNLISGQTNGTVLHGGTTSSNVVNGSTIGDTEPFYDQCSNSGNAINADGTPGGVTASMSGQNVGDLLNSKGVTWGWFQGGFTPSGTVLQNGVTRVQCNTSHVNVGAASVADYVEHHEPFQYYASTANPDHVSPTSVSQVGISDPAGTPITKAVNHQYDISWFNQALAAGNLPQVSFLKAPAYEDAHPGNSDPLDEQKFVVDEINAIEQSPYWSSTAIIIAYDDSDGWYDHQMGPIVRGSQSASDSLTGAGMCGTPAQIPVVNGVQQNDRCGVGPRTPLLVISPWARSNFVDHTFTEQASITQFIEQNWGLGQIGGGSADATAGTLDNMFDFNGNDPRSPAVILNDQNGEVQNVIAPVTVSPGGTVAGVLSLSLASATPNLGAFVAGVAQTYTASDSATVTTTAGSATLTVTDPSTFAPGHLVNGTFSLAQPLSLNATDAANPVSAFQPLGAAPLTILTYTGPQSNDAVTIGFQQPISATDPLRTGQYTKTLTFTLQSSTL